MSRKLIAQLKGIKNENGQLNPDRSWVAKNRAELVENIKLSANVEVENEAVKPNVFDTISESLHIFVPSRVLSVARSSLTILLIGTIAVSGWIASVSASVDSLPGDTLYGVKMAAEKTELIVASVIGSDEDEVTTILKHASTRVDEYQRSESTEQATEAIKSLKEKIVSTQDSLDKVNSKSPEKAVAVAKVVEKKTEEILDSLTGKEVKEKTTAENTAPETSQDQLKKDVADAETLIETTGIKAVGVLVDNVNKGEVGEDVITKDEVKDTINRKLNKLAEGVSKLDGTVAETSEKASSTIAIIKTTTSTPSVIATTTVKYVEAEFTEDDVVSSTEPISDQTDDTEQKVVDAEQKVVVAEQKVMETSKKVEETKVEVQTLIDSDDLSGALQKIIELGDIKTETKAAVGEATDAVQQVLVLDPKVNTAPTTSSTPPIIDPDETVSSTNAEDVSVTETVEEAVEAPITN